MLCVRRALLFGPTKLRQRYPASGRQKSALLIELRRRGHPRANRRLAGDSLPVRADRHVAGQWRYRDIGNAHYANEDRAIPGQHQTAIGRGRKRPGGRIRYTEQSASYGDFVFRSKLQTRKAWTAPPLLWLPTCLAFSCETLRSSSPQNGRPQYLALNSWAVSRSYRENAVAPSRIRLTATRSRKTKRCHASVSKGPTQHKQNPDRKPVWR